MARPKDRISADDILPDERCPAHLVDELVELHYSREAVERWTGAKARAALSKHKRDTGIATARADGVAQRLDGVSYPPPMPERLEAAAGIGAALGKADEWELILAVEHGVRQLAGDELARLAAHLIQRLKTTPELPQAAALLGTTAPARSKDAPTAPADRSVEL